jgi:hypothetical protein
MGCDIHVYMERWTNSNKYDGPKDLSEDRDNKLNELLENEPTKFRWVSVDKWNYDRDGWRTNWEDLYYEERNYQLFSILADVRGDYSPIVEPRGIPEDASTGYKYMCDRWDGDAHSHSYYTLTELLNVNWEEYDDCHLNDFLKSIERMKGIDEDTDNIRMCFFFDN